MLNIRITLLLMTAVTLLTGFTWGFGGDPCRDAREQADTLESIRDDVLIRQREAKILELCPDGAAAHYVTALQFERVGNTDGAISEYRKAQLKDRGFARASGNLGLLYAQKGMKDEAAVELAKGLGAFSDPRYHKAMAIILVERKVYSLAAYHYGEAVRGLPRDPSLFTGLAEIHMASGQPDRALEEYQRALSIDPGFDKAHVGSAAIHLARNDQDKALAQLKAAATATPGNREVHLMMAEIYEKKGDQKQADYEYLLGGKPRKTAAAPSALSAPAAAVPVVSPTLDKDIEGLKAQLKEQPESVTAYEKLGSLYRSAGRDDEAIAAYREAAHRNSSNSDVYVSLGALYEKREQLDEAVVSYKQAIKVKPDNADARLRLADIRNARGFYQEAVEQYSEFLKLKPESPDIQLKLARILARTKEAGLAIDAYLAVLKHSPDNVDANREIAALYKNRGAAEKAIEHYRMVLAQQKDDMETRNSLVALYVKNKQYDEIAELLKGTVELFPDDPNNHYKLGLIYDFKKDYDNAIASYKKAIELKPDHARSLNALGRVYMKTGRLSEAKETLELAKKADPNLEETAVLLNNIRDEFNPEPRKISKGKKSKSKKSKKGAKQSKATAKGAAKKKP